MAERSHWWIERRLISLTLSLTVYLPTYLSSYVSIYLSLYLAIYLSLSLFHLITLSIYLSIYLSLSLFHLSLCLAVYLSICLSMYLSIYRSISLSLFHLSLCLASKRGRRPPVFNTFDFRMCFAPQRRALFRHLDLEMCFAPQRRALFRHLNFQKWSETASFLHFWCVLYIFFTLLTWKCASRHNGVHFFDISTSKSGPKLRCFGHFDLEMCFAPQRRALFRHLNFQKWSEAEVFWTFWPGNVLRATTACTFSTSQLPKVVRSWGVLDILTWKCASRHNGVQFFISHLASWLRTRRFSEPTFRASGATNHWKNTVFRDFPTFSRICIFFLLTLSLLWSSLF